MHASESWPDLLEPGVKIKAMDNYMTFKKKSSMLKDIFGMETSSKSYEKYSSLSEMEDFDVFSGTVNYADTYQGFDTKIEFVEKVKGIQIERKLYDDDLTGEIKKRSEVIGRAAARTEEKDGASVFNDAFTVETSDYVTHTEAAELCASDHAYTNGSSSTQSNEGTTALSATAVEATRRLMIKFRGDNGDILTIDPNALIAPVDLEETAFEIINSKGKVETDDNNVNFHYGKYELLVWKNFLTDTNNWFMVDHDLMKRYLLWIDRVKLEINQDKDSDTFVAKYVGYMRYWRWWINWRFIYGHLVS